MRLLRWADPNLISPAKNPKPDDAADALAIAVCHAHSSHMMNLSKLAN